MLSLSMVKVLRSLPFSSLEGTNKDGRVLHALRSRGIITKVEWNNSLSTYTFRLTQLGQRVVRNLRFLNEDILEELFK